MAAHSEIETIRIVNNSFSIRGGHDGRSNYSILIWKSRFECEFVLFIVVFQPIHANSIQFSWFMNFLYPYSNCMFVIRKFVFTLSFRIDYVGVDYVSMVFGLIKVVSVTFSNVIPNDMMFICMYMWVCFRIQFISYISQNLSNCNATCSTQNFGHQCSTKKPVVDFGSILNGVKTYMKPLFNLKLVS